MKIIKIPNDIVFIYEEEDIQKILEKATKKEKIGNEFFIKETDPYYKMYYGWGLCFYLQILKTKKIKLSQIIQNFKIVIASKEARLSFLDRKKDHFPVTRVYYDTCLIFPILKLYYEE